MRCRKVRLSGGKKKEEVGRYVRLGEVGGKEIQK